MCFKCIKWAWDQSIKPSSAKFVLLAISDLASIRKKYGDLPTAFASIKHYSLMTGQDEKTVQKNIKILMDMGYITDTGFRTGSKNLTRVISINTKNGNIPKTVTYQKRISTQNCKGKDPKNGGCKDPKNGNCNLLKEPIKEPINNNRSNFELFWNMYPRKVNKGKARKLFETIAKKHDVDLLLTALQNQINAGQFSNDKQFVPHPTTWLNGERWNDEITQHQGIIYENGIPVSPVSVKPKTRRQLHEEGLAKALESRSQL